MDQEEVKRGKEILSRLYAIKETIDELMYKRATVEQERRDWWREIQNKYGLDPDGSYYFEDSTGEIWDVASDEELTAFVQSLKITEGEDIEH